MPSSTAFTLQTLDGGENPQDSSDAGIEAVCHHCAASRTTETYTEATWQNLDTQYTVGVATNVTTTFISVGDDSQDGIFGFMDIVNFLLGEAAPPQVLTTSYGADEGGLSPILVQYVSILLAGTRS